MILSCLVRLYLTLIANNKYEREMKNKNTKNRLINTGINPIKDRFVTDNINKSINEMISKKVPTPFI